MVLSEIALILFTGAHARFLIFDENRGDSILIFLLFYFYFFLLERRTYTEPMNFLLLMLPYQQAG